MTRLGTDLALHLPLELGLDLAGAVTPPAVEVPETIPGLMAWFDSRSTEWFALGAGGEVSAWMSRAGSLSGIAWLQGTASNQPIRVASEPTMNGLPAVRLDGINDWLDANSPTAGQRLHTGLGASSFRIFRIDSTGGLNQRLLSSMNAASEIGVFHLHQTGATITQIANGSGVLVSNWTINAVSHTARDVSRWQMWAHSTGLAHSRVSGSNLTFADAGGPPSLAAPTRTLRLGASPGGVSPVKGLLAQELYYDHVPTAGETTQLANYFAPIYGIAA